MRRGPGRGSKVELSPSDGAAFVQQDTLHWNPRTKFLHDDSGRIPLEDGPLSWTHENNTLVIQYKKPAAILQREKEAKIERLSAPDQAEAPDGQECKQQ